MLFNTFDFFLIFLPIVFIGYQLLLRLGDKRLAGGFLILSNLFFYGYWNPAYLPLLLFSILFNYYIGSWIDALRHRDDVRFYGISISIKRLLILGITTNLGLLGYFKYTDFLLENVNVLTGAELPLPNVILPLAISFFTFQQIAYLVDIYKGNKSSAFGSYFLFVSFFPQLIAGPIVHHKEMMPQFNSNQHTVFNYHHVLLGVLIFSFGLFKKVYIADSFAVWATDGFDNQTSLGVVEAWITSLSYSMQLYFDFSGYSDMAIGLALIFNIRLPRNFNSPYHATSIQDFWRRWHMTLSRFLRDYIYIPLGGNRVTEFRILFNLFITFFIGGIWHGAGWGFVIWGILHGLAVVTHRLWSLLNVKMHWLLGWFITFNFVNIAWVFFRATSIEDAVKVLTGMFSFHLFDVSVFQELLSTGDWVTALLIAITAAFLIFGDINDNNEKRLLNPVVVVVISVLFFISCITINSVTVSEFLYFEF